MSKVMVLGAGGMLGHKLCQTLSNCGHEVFGVIRKEPDHLRRFSEVYSRTQLIGGVDALNDAALQQLFKEFKPAFLVNCVGIVKQLAEAENAYLSVAINSYLPHRLVRLCNDHGARLIHISTDCVFSGTRGNYTESDPSDAVDLYGKSKFLGETTAADSCAVTLRTSFIGRELHRPTHGLVDWFLAQQKKQIKGFSKAIYTGFTSIELSKVIGRLIERRQPLSGLYQTASTPITKFDLLQMLRVKYKMDVDIQRDEAFQCDRSMRADRFESATGYVTPSWSQMIQEMHDDPTPYELTPPSK